MLAQGGVLVWEGGGGVEGGGLRVGGGGGGVGQGGGEVVGRRGGGRGRRVEDVSVVASAGHAAGDARRLHVLSPHGWRDTSRAGLDIKLPRAVVVPGNRRRVELQLMPLFLEARRTKRDFSMALFTVVVVLTQVSGLHSLAKLPYAAQMAGRETGRGCK